MGSAQSARRIQPGGARPAVPRRADLSRSPFLPTPPPARPFPSPLAGAGAARGRGRGWGRRGTAPRPATGRRRAHFHRRRCAATGSGTAGKARRGRWLGGGGATRGRRTTPPRVLQPPGSSARRIPGPREPDTRRRALLPPLGAEAGPPLPRRDRSPTSPPILGGPGVGADCPQCAPGVVAPSGPGGFVGHAAPVSGAEPSARGRRRCRLPTRPVLKHGPRSLTRARVGGSSESRRGAMKVKGAPPRGGPRGGIPRPLPVRRGRTTGPSRPPRRGGGARAHALGPERW